MSVAMSAAIHYCSYNPPSSLLPKRQWKARKAEKRQGHRRWRPLRARQKRRKSRTTAPRAPFNTTTFIMRAKKSGGLAVLLSPSPLSFSPDPRFSEGLADEANQEWGVNGYGSMNGLIRFRGSSLGHVRDVDEGESELEHASNIQSLQRLENRLDHDIRMFEMIFPTSSTKQDAPNLLETRIEEQDSHIAHLEEENLSLKERLLIMEQELYDLRSRMQNLEGGAEDQAEVCSGRSSRVDFCVCS